MAKKWALAIVWSALGAVIAIRALSGFAPRSETRPIVIPLRPSSWQPVAATHVTLIAEPGTLWALLPARDGHIAAAVRIGEEISQLSGQDTLYARVASIEIVVPPPEARWYDLHAPSDTAETVRASVEYSDDLGGDRFEVRIGGRKVVVTGNPTFPAKATAGALVEVSADLTEELVPWCVLGRDLAEVSRGHQTYQTLVATRVSNALVSLCCMAGNGPCVPGQH